MIDPYSKFAKLLKDSIRINSRIFFKDINNKEANIDERGQTAGSFLLQVKEIYSNYLERVAKLILVESKKIISILNLTDIDKIEIMFKRESRLILNSNTNLPKLRIEEHCVRIGVPTETRKACIRGIDCNSGLILESMNHEIDLYLSEISVSKDSPPDKSNEFKKTNTENKSGELEAAQHLLLKMRNKIRRKKEYSHYERNLDELKNIIDETRKVNGKHNYSAIGRKIGTDNQTAQRWIENLGLKKH